MIRIMGFYGSDPADYLSASGHTIEEARTVLWNFVSEMNLKLLYQIVVRPKAKP